MRIQMVNFKYKGNDVSYITANLKVQLSTELNQLNIASHINYGEEDLNFFPVKDKKLFVSTIKNKIMMKPGDARISKTGRDYLSSERLTKEQYDGMIEVLNKFFDKTGIECDIRFYEFDNDSTSFSLWRKGEVRQNVYKPNSFPVKV
jgi:hypothetical protein